MAATGPANRSEPQGRAYVRLVLLGALVGIPAALVAALFLALVHESQHWVWVDLPDALGSSAYPWYLVLLLPVVGAVLVIFARAALPGNGGHPPLAGLSMAKMPLSYAPGVALAAFGTLTFGVVLGPEAPVIALGAIAASAASAFARLGQKEGKVIATAGSFSAISALFGGPLVGGVLLVESGVALGAELIAALLPGFVAAAVGYTIFVGFGDWGGLGAQGLTIPHLGAYDTTRVVDLLFAVAIGIVVAMILTSVRRLARGVAARVEGEHNLAAPLLAGALAIGLIALAADGLGAQSQDVLFSGQSSIPALVSEGSTAVILVLLVAKALAYAVSLASGFRGGPIFPALFLGIGVATLPVVWFDVSPTFAIAVGAAAGMAAQTRLILSSMLLAALLVGSAGFDAIPGAVLAAAAAWITTMALDPPAPTPSPAADSAPARA
jgi:H+/Cl- antiporter ClcA